MPTRKVFKYSYTLFSFLSLSSFSFILFYFIATIVSWKVLCIMIEKEPPFVPPLSVFTFSKYFFSIIHCF
uniref:Uncharacterized protein n=1 Tax=Rhizophora mucronata TaxID=61149 RepID=A0A2P2QRP1_RHIMU